MIDVLAPSVTAALGASSLMLPPTVLRPLSVTVPLTLSESRTSNAPELLAAMLLVARARSLPAEAKMPLAAASVTTPPVMVLAPVIAPVAAVSRTVLAELGSRP